jgi:hypothetical protein
VFGMPGSVVWPTRAYAIKYRSQIFMESVKAPAGKGLAVILDLVDGSPGGIFAPPRPATVSSTAPSDRVRADEGKEPIGTILPAP